MSQNKPFPHIKHIIAIASGKGGVGKSTVSVNLALGLVAQGLKVGLLDADIYGPSQPSMLGDAKKPLIKDKKLCPLERHGLKAMSMGYLIEDNAAMIWRGPMVSMALTQLIHDTEWGELDYLIIDMPPGTGDIHLTLAQKIPVDGALIVTTPQDLALSDARRAVEMFLKLNVPVLGIIENMSLYDCPNCGHQTHLFGADGGRKLADQYDLQLLANIPLDKQIRELTDQGIPPTMSAPDSAYAQMFFQLAKTVLAHLALLKKSQKKDYSNKFPRIVVEQRSKEETS